MNDGTDTSPWGEPAGAYEDSSPFDSDTGTETFAGNRSAPVTFSPYARLPESTFHRAFRMSRATIGLIIIAAGLGLLLAAGLGGIIWAIAQAIHHAASA
jgi:hypothetical protein